jgi:hypothetical protein
MFGVPGTGVLSQAAALMISASPCCQIAMDITMGYMLILMV